jgi:(2Fe-2S) ferredoxin
MADQPADGCTITACRDCCCGTAAKHPGVDHDAQLHRLRERLPAPHRVRTSACLDACAQSNLIVVHPSGRARLAGARPVWFGLVTSDAVTDDIIAWVHAGGPGVAPLSAALELSVVRGQPA